ncbi:MAG: PrpR N-terminal domain-containing protein, partial [Oscillibacter sp.]
MQQELDWTQVVSAQEICMLAPTRLLADKARSIIAERGDPADVFVAVTDPSEIIACATALAQRGAKIIISRKGTQQIVEGNVDIKVVGLNNTLTDYLQMLKDRGLHVPGLIAFFSYDPLSEEVMRMCQMVDVQARNYLFKNPVDCR